MVSKQTTKPTFRSRFETVIPYLKDYKGYLIGGVIAVIVSTALMLISPYLIKSIFDLLEKRATSDEILVYVLLMFFPARQCCTTDSRLAT